MYRLVIFDLDGTLLNTLGDLAAAGNHALQRMGLSTHATEEYKLFVGNGIPNLIHRILPEVHSDEQHSRCYEFFNEYYNAHKTDLTVPYEGITELVKKLDGMGIVCCVNTNKAHEFAKELIQRFFGDSIKAVIGQGSGYALKPSPEAAAELCCRFDVAREDAIYVGDSNVDMKTAAAAGLDACGVLWGFRERAELEGCGPKYIAENAVKLEAIITRA